MFNNLQFYWLNLDKDGKKEFKQKFFEATGTDNTTFYRHLRNEPNKLTKKLLSDITGIALEDLYTLVKIEQTIKTPKQ